MKIIVVQCFHIQTIVYFHSINKFWRTRYYSFETDEKAFGEEAMRLYIGEIFEGVLASITKTNYLSSHVDTKANLFQRYSDSYYDQSNN